MKRVLLGVFATVALALPAGARPKPPSDEHHPRPLPFVAVAGAMVAAEYFLGMAQHEGSHWLAAKLVGVDRARVWLLPRWEDGGLSFGSLQIFDPGWDKELSRGQRAFILYAPKIPNLVVLGTYSALLERGLLPKNRWVNLAFTVYAAGNLGDFSKELFYWTNTSDFAQLYSLYGYETPRERLGFRLMHGALAAGAAYQVGRGVYRVLRGEGFTPAPEKRPRVSVSFNLRGVTLSTKF
jgi:hypothetical protein